MCPDDGGAAGAARAAARGELTSSQEREALRTAVEKLDEPRVRVVLRFVESIAREITVAASPSWLPSGWHEAFAAEIAVHHGTTPQPLVLGGLEAAFRNACAACALAVSPQGSATQRFVDVVVGEGSRGRSLSLKSTAQKRLHEGLLHVSKLTEAAWIQDMRTARERRRRAIELVGQFCGAVDSIVLLRAFRDQSEAVPTRYELVEIPASLLRLLAEAPEDAFASDGPAVPLPWGSSQPSLVFSIDRSDAKVTLRRVRKSACVVLGDWTLGR